MPTIIQQETLFTIGNTAITNDQLIVFVAAVVMMVAARPVRNRTRLGRGMRAVAQDPETAALMGVNIDRVIMLTSCSAASWPAWPALLYAMQFEAPQYNVGFLLGIKAFTAAVLGGIGNLRGALLGGLMLGLIENYGARSSAPSGRTSIAFVVLVLVLMFRPTGLLGESLGRARA